MSAIVVTPGAVVVEYTTGILASRAFLRNADTAGTVAVQVGFGWHTALFRSSTRKAVVLGSTLTATGAGMGGITPAAALPDAAGFAAAEPLAAGTPLAGAPLAAGLADAAPPAPDAPVDAAGLAEAEAAPEAAAGLAEAAVEAGDAAAADAAAGLDAGAAALAGAGLEAAGALLAGAAPPPHPTSARVSAMGPMNLEDRRATNMPVTLSANGRGIKPAALAAARPPDRAAGGSSLSPAPPWSRSMAAIGCCRSAPREWP
jgi:hypothetical protein